VGKKEPKETKAKKPKASSEKSSNSKKLIKEMPGKEKAKVQEPKVAGTLHFAHAVLEPESTKQPTDESGAKDGKSFDNTNASVQNNENEQVSEKDVAMKVEKPPQHVATQKLDLHDDLDDEDFMKDGINLGEDDHSYHHNDYMSIPRAHEHSKDDGDELDDEHLVKNMEFEPDYSEPIQHMGPIKMPESDHFDGPHFGMDHMNEPIADFSHHSDLYNDGFIGMDNFNA
jgi:hypothetical protein